LKIYYTLPVADVIITFAIIIEGIIFRLFICVFNCGANVDKYLKQKNKKN